MLKFISRFVSFCIIVGTVSTYAAFTIDPGAMPVSGATQWPNSSTPSFSSGVQFQIVRNIRVSATSPRLLYINKTANSITFQASVRKSWNGTPEMVLVGGNSTITIPAYSSALSDALSFNVTAGDIIYDRSFFSLSSSQSFSASTIFGTYNPEGVSVTGSISGYNLWAGYVSTATSRLLEGGKTFEMEIPLAANGQFIFGAYAVVGVPTDSSVRFTTLVGDSKTAYNSPDYSSGSGRQWGQFGMGVGSGAPYQNLATGGDTLSGFLNATAINILRRELLTVFGGDVINHYGTNSVGNGSVPSTTATTELGLINQLKNLLTGDMRLFQITLDSVANKTGGSSWVTITEGDQSGGGNGNNGVATSVYLNNILKTSKPSYIDGVIDLAAVTMTENGYWRPNMTGDGIHQNTNANILQGAAFDPLWPAPLVSQSISSISATPSDNAPTISWSTGRASSSKINYGLTSSYGTSSSETNTSTRVSSHSVGLSGLVSCAKYHYQIDGYDGYFSRGQSSDQTLITSGCTAGASVLDSSANTTITTASGGSFTFDSAQIVVPTAFTGSASSAVFQAKELEPTAFFSTIAGPNGKNRAGNYVLNLKALTSPTTNLSNFDAPITITLPYADIDVASINVSTLKIQRYDSGTGWTQLDNCSVNTGAKTVTCTTTHFSDFVLFGDPGDSTAPVISSFVANTNNPLSAAISFATDEGATSTIRYGLTNAYGTTTTISGSLTQNHAITLTGLAQCIVYHYSLTVTDTLGNTMTTSDETFQASCNANGGGGIGSGGLLFVITPTPGTSLDVVPVPNAPNSPSSIPVSESTSHPVFSHTASSANFLFLSEDPTILTKLQSIYGTATVTETIYKNQCETNQGKPYYRVCSLGIDLATFDLFRDSVLCEGFITEQPTETEYRFGDTASRKEVVGIAVKMKKVGGKNVALVTSSEYQNTYADIGLPGEASWIQPVAETALKYGIVSSVRKLFEPDRQVTRAEAYAMMMDSVCMLSHENESTGKTWQENLYARATTEGLTNKTWGTFDSEKPILRQELFVLASKVSDWAERTGGCNPKPEYCFVR